jgi:hypothetical protein
MTKPVLGLILGGTLGLMDGLSGLLEPSLAPIMASVITFSMLKGLVSGIAIGYLAQKVRSMMWGILAGIAIAAIFSLMVWMHAGMKLFVDIVVPGMLLGAIVGFATQRWGNLDGTATVARAGEVSK